MAPTRGITAVVVVVVVVVIVVAVFFSLIFIYIAHFTFISTPATPAPQARHHT